MVQYSETTMKYELKPLTVAAILDQSILILKNHFGLFLKLMFCLAVPVGLVFDFFVARAMPMPAPNPTPEEMAEILHTQFQFIFRTALPFSALLILVILPLTHGAIIYAAAQIYFGKPVGVVEAYRVALKRGFPMVGTWILMYLLVAGGTMLCVLPGILVLFWCVLTSSIVIIEGVSGFTAIRRSYQLMQAASLEHYLQCFLLYVVIFFIQAGVGAGEGFLLDPRVASFVGTFLQAVTRPLEVICILLFYFSCRCRAENFDLVRLAQDVANAPSTPAHAIQG
jgi:hypothetical protein